MEAESPTGIEHLRKRRPAEPEQDSQDLSACAGDRKLDRSHSAFEGCGDCDQEHGRAEVPEQVSCPQHGRERSPDAAVLDRAHSGTDRVLEIAGRSVNEAAGCGTHDPHGEK